MSAVIPVGGDAKPLLTREKTQPVEGEAIHEGRKWTCWGCVEPDRPWYKTSAGVITIYCLSDVALFGGIWAGRIMQDSGYHWVAILPVLAGAGCMVAAFACTINIGQG